MRLVARGNVVPGARVVFRRLWLRFLKISVLCRLGRLYRAVPGQPGGHLGEGARPDRLGELGLGVRARGVLRLLVGEVAAGHPVTRARGRDLLPAVQLLALVTGPGHPGGVDKLWFPGKPCRRVLPLLARDLADHAQRVLGLVLIAVVAGLQDAGRLDLVQVPIGLPGVVGRALPGGRAVDVAGPVPLIAPGIGLHARLQQAARLQSGPASVVERPLDVLLDVGVLARPHAVRVGRVRLVPEGSCLPSTSMRCPDKPFQAKTALTINNISSDVAADPQARSLAAAVGHALGIHGDRGAVSALLRLRHQRIGPLRVALALGGLLVIGVRLGCSRVIRVGAVTRGIAVVVDLLTGAAGTAADGGSRKRRPVG